MSTWPKEVTESSRAHFFPRANLEVCRQGECSQMCEQVQTISQRQSGGPVQQAVRVFGPEQGKQMEPRPCTRDRLRLGLSTKRRESPKRTIRVQVVVAFNTVCAALLNSISPSSFRLASIARASHTLVAKENMASFLVSTVMSLESSL